MNLFNQVSRKAQAAVTINQISIFILVVLAAFSRFLPHPPNFTAIGALAVFSGAYIADRKLAVVLPLVALLIGDAFFGWHSTMLFVYSGFGLSVLLNHFVLSGKVRVSNVLGSALMTSIVFFAVSNFGVWFMDSMYPKSVEGLMACYIAALPFFDNQIAGDLTFVAVIFAAKSLFDFAQIKSKQSL
jgi:hypothetical protein